MMLSNNFYKDFEIRVYMELKRPLLGMQIGSQIKKEYEDAFENLKRTDSYDESLEFMTSMFETLEKSRPNSGQGIDWARDIIEAYRTTGKLFIKVHNHYEEKSEELSENLSEKLKNLEEKMKDFENIFS